jgi:hypothetical protein
MPADHDLPPAGQRHQAHVQKIIRSAAPQLGTHQQQVAHAENLKQVAQRQEHSVEAAADAPQSLVRKDRER